MSLHLEKPHLEKPHPVLLPLSSYSSRTHVRSPSRASPTRARITDDLLSDLSPSTTLAAFTYSSSHSSGKLRASIEAASPGEREFGIRAATAASKIKEWYSELKDWPWPESGSTGFEVPLSKRSKLSIPEKDRTFGPEGFCQTNEDLLARNTQEDLYCGSLPAQDVPRYSVRIDEILDDMEDLDVAGIKSHILDLHIPGRSRPTSSASTAPSPAPPFSSYTKMDDFTAVVTATVLQALPYLARLQLLMEVWEVRLLVLQQTRSLLDALEDAEAAVRSGWQALDTSFSTVDNGQERNDDASEAHQKPFSRETFTTMQQALQNRVTLAGQKLDRMLDSLEGRLDTLPDAWLDRMDSVERKYADWAALANRKVLEGEFARQNTFSKKSIQDPEQSCPKIVSPPNLKSEDDRPKVSQKRVSIDPVASETKGPFGISVGLAKPLLTISLFDGGKESQEEPTQTECSQPITPQTPSIATSKLPENEAGSMFPSTPPSSRSCNDGRGLPSSSIGEHHFIRPVSEDISKTPDFELPSKNQSELVPQMDGQSESTVKKRRTELRKVEKRADEPERDTEQPPATPRKHSDDQLVTGALTTSASPTTPRNSSSGRNETTDMEKSFREDSETPRESSPMHSIISTGSSYAVSDSSPTSNRVSPSHYPRRILSPIQSSAEWFDFDDVKTPTKDPLRGNPNVSNAIHSKQDGQKTPTPNDKLGSNGKTAPSAESSDDERLRNQDNLDDAGERKTGGESLSTKETATPDPKNDLLLSLEQASPEGDITPLPPLRSGKSPQLLDSPDFSTPLKIPETSQEPPMLPNVGVLEAPTLFSPTKGPGDQLQQQISEILESLPTRIHLATEFERNTFPDLKVPKKRAALKKTASASSLRMPSRSPTPTPSFTLAPAYSKNSPRPRHQNANPEIKLYHLSRSNGGAPIKLFVRLVGDSGERVMVRVGGGWADLGEYLREYAIHHSRRNAPEDKIHIHDSSSRIVSTSSVSSARDGRSSSFSRSVSSMEGSIARPATSLGNRRTSTQTERPASSLAIRRTRDSRKSLGSEEARMSPKTPGPAINRARRATSVSQQETPPSAGSIGSRSSSRLSYNGEDSYLGLSGPRSKPKELSEENEKWVESMTEKVRKASAEKEKKHMALLGELGKAGSTKRLFRKN